MILKGVMCKDNPDKFSYNGTIFTINDVDYDLDSLPEYDSSQRFYQKDGISHGLLHVNISQFFIFEDENMKTFLNIDSDNVSVEELQIIFNYLNKSESDRREHNRATSNKKGIIDGLGSGASNLGDYPIDTFLIRNENRTVYDILRRIEKGSFIMNPEFQRDFIWGDEKQSKLIESVLMRIPLPVFYLAEEDDGRLVVVDGLQRLSTFKRFVDNGFKLKLPDQNNLYKKQFKDLSSKLQNRIEDCNLVLYIIDSKVAERAKLEIFERVNAGVPLTRQQMRNSLYMGKATAFLKEEANSDLFLNTTGKSLRTSSMRDREFVNRFCAFQILSVDEYRSDMDEFLAMALKKMNDFNDTELKNLSDQFRNSLNNNYIVFGKHSFRRSADGMSSRSVINASLWDVFSTGLSHSTEAEVKNKATEIKDSFSDLMKEDKFIKSITRGTNDKKMVSCRFEMTSNMLKEIFNA